MRLIAFDDDPTGCQTAWDSPLLLRWDGPEVAAVLADPAAVRYVLLNTRALDAAAAAATARAAAAACAHPDLVPVSRGDSTLRGHFPCELRAICHGQAIDAYVVCPALVAAGRVTVDDVHHLVRDGGLVPLHETEYARDPHFPYASSHLPTWIAARAGVPLEGIRSLSRRLLRQGSAAVAVWLQGCRHGVYVVANVASDEDAAVLASGIRQAHAAGWRCALHTAPSLLGHLAGFPPGLRAEFPLRHGPGLVVVGSHVPLADRQLAALQRLDQVAPITLEVDAAADPARSAGQARHALRAVRSAQAAGRLPVLATTRGMCSLDQAAGMRVTGCLAAVVKACAPAWVLSKGGITGHRVLADGLGARQARVLGPIAPGVPAIQVGACLHLLVPGNVGDDSCLAELAMRMWSLRTVAAEVGMGR